MDEILHDLSPSALGAAIEENMVAFFRSSTRAAVHDDPDLLWWITDRPWDSFNMLFRAKLTPESVHATLEAAIARARARQVSLAWWTGPTTRPATLGRTLESYGFVLEELVGMAVDLHALRQARPVAGLVIERVHHAETLRQWGHVYALGFDLPSEAAAGWLAGMDFAAQQPLRHYLGSMEGVPVAISSLCLAAGVAGIYSVATLPPFRRRGIGAAMTLAPLREAQTQGYRTGILQASAQGFTLYARLGFREVCKIGAYTWNHDSKAVQQVQDGGGSS
jgi:GNAT superfamily N-acetyltransferase